MTNLETALWYRSQGYSIIPCLKDKKPAIEWKQYQERLPSEEEINQWYKNGSTNQIGLVTGKLSKVVVVDVDDLERGLANLKQYIDLSIDTPIVKTPTGGYHIYFKYPDVEVRNNAGAIPGCDFRGEGGFVVAPPSRCEYEKKGQQVKGSYTWVKAIALAPLAELPLSYIKALDSFSLYRQVSDQEKEKVSESQLKSAKVSFFVEGRRDEDLFHVANSLVKGHCNSDMTQYILEMLANNCDPPFPQKEIHIKIKSALERAARKERNIAGEVREWLKSVEGQFKVSNWSEESAIVSKEQKHAGIVAFSQLCKEGLIEKLGTKRGEYRKVDREVEFMDYVNVDTSNQIHLKLPLGIGRKTLFFPKGVLVIAGVTGFGKTTISLNIIQMNMFDYDWYYFASEGSALALNHKLSKFNYPIDQWKFKVIPEESWDYLNIQDKVFPDGMNVIDYLDPEGEKTYNIHGVIKGIIKRLNKGMAIITVQKKPGADLSEGGIYSAKASSLYLTLDWGTIKIFKNRYRDEDKDAQFNMRDFEIAPGSIIKPKGGWYNETTKKQADRVKSYPQHGIIDDEFIPEEEER